MRTMLAVLLFLPLTARADVLVEFWGKVDWVISGTEKVGNAISGIFHINESLAPVDRHPDPNAGNYVWNAQGCIPDCPRVPSPSGFVTDGSSTVGDSDDHVWSEDYADHDSYGVENTEQGVDSVFHRVELYAPTFTSGQGIAQSFDVNVTAASGTGWYTVNDVIGGVASFFGATLDRLRVSMPVAKLSCHAQTT